MILIKKTIKKILTKNISKKKYKITGRIKTKNILGGISFFKITDFKHEIQIIIKKTLLNYKKIVNQLSLGDLILIKGSLCKNKKEEKCFQALKIKLISKNYFKLSNKNCLNNLFLKFQYRYLDFFFNKKNFNNIIFRHKLIKNIRKFFYKKKFLEIETPILNKLGGGADCKEFYTYCNSLKTTVTLRISPELFLKKAIICGYNKIFEIGKNFRNEGISKTHYPEFTFLEFYVAYTNYKWSMRFLEKMLKKIIYKTIKKKYFIFKNKKILYLKKFKKISIKNIILKSGVKNKYINDISFFKKKLKFKLKNKILNNDINIYHYYYFEKNIKKKIVYPTFITKFPSFFSPLAKKIKNKTTSERYELYICGLELSNGYTEINKFKEQKKNFKIQKKYNNKKIDYSYINYMKYGMPPASGCGLGVDRLIMILRNCFNIKKTILFTN
ncbi:amino acid--tRNA ligase-related protein [Candidatus Vidania fulgoroideorum]